MPMEITTRENGKMTKPMDTESTFIAKQEQSTKGIGNKTCSMGQE